MSVAEGSFRDEETIAQHEDRHRHGELHAHEAILGLQRSFTRRFGERDVVWHRKNCSGLALKAPSIASIRALHCTGSYRIQAVRNIELVK